jgi:hypothetical protein
MRLSVPQHGSDPAQYLAVPLWKTWFFPTFKILMRTEGHAAGTDRSSFSPTATFVLLPANKAGPIRRNGYRCQRNRRVAVTLQARQDPLCWIRMSVRAAAAVIDVHSGSGRSIPYRYATVFGWFANTRGSNGKDIQAGQGANAPHAVVPPVRHPLKLIRHAYARGHSEHRHHGGQPS